MKLVIFDVDGTLVDSQNIIVASQHAAFAAFDLEPPSRELSLSIVGLSLAEAFVVLAGPHAPIVTPSQPLRRCSKVRRICA